MQTRDWGRLLTAMLTPFDASGAVNVNEARRVASWLVDKMRNDGIVVSGTTGESPTLSETEKLALLEATLEEVGHKAAVIFGAGTYDTKESVHMAREAERRGAHGIMVVNPYYSRPGQEGLYAHFRAVAEATSLPVMLYNIMPRSAINLETSTLMRLIQDVPNIVAVKEASGSVGQISEVIAGAPASFRVYSGDDGMTLPVLSLGGHGIVSVAAHVVGDKMKDMIERFCTDPASAAETNKSLVPVFKALFAYPSPVPVKYALSLNGFDCEDVRLPLVKLADQQKSAVRSAMPQTALA